MTGGFGGQVKDAGERQIFWEKMLGEVRAGWFWLFLSWFCSGQ
ncbi:hypothetical protein [Bartonella massiliensis]|nr:hypothetical protein [Bartonella massiliensis]